MGNSRSFVISSISDCFGRATNTAKRIRSWGISSRYINIRLRGTNRSVFSWLEDEGVLLSVREHIASVGEKPTSLSLAQVITEYLKEEEMSGEVQEVETVIRNENSKVKRPISERTARNWLNSLGFEWEGVRKGVYFDGHQREGVICYQQEVFPPEMQRLFDSGLQEWTGDGNIILKEIQMGEKRRILVTHAESTFNANDWSERTRIQNDTQPLRKKSKDRGILVSEFLTPRGRLAIPEQI